MAQLVKNQIANAGDAGDTDSMAESGGSLEEGMATHSTMPAWRWAEEPGGLQPMGSQPAMTEWLSMHTHNMQTF